MKIVSMEKFIEGLDAEVYPITIIKFLLNKRKVAMFFEKALDENFEIRGIRYKVDYEGCEQCAAKQNEGVLCRQHTSIHRILSANKVAFDEDTNTYFYRNEIFRMVGGKLVIVYCPHPKLIKGEMTDEKVRKIIPITIDDPDLKFPDFEITRPFLSSTLMEQHNKCWFNDDFSIVTIPEDRNNANWCLVANK